MSYLSVQWFDDVIAFFPFLDWCTFSILFIFHLLITTIFFSVAFFLHSSFNLLLFVLLQMFVLAMKLYVHNIQLHDVASTLCKCHIANIHVMHVCNRNEYKCWSTSTNWYKCPLNCVIYSRVELEKGKKKKRNKKKKKNKKLRKNKQLFLFTSIYV